MDGYGNDGYNNAKARRSGGLLKRVALMGIRWPAMQRGALLLLLLLPLLLAATLLAPALLAAPASSSLPTPGAGSSGAQGGQTAGHQAGGSGGGSHEQNTAASQQTPELQDPKIRQNVGGGAQKASGAGSEGKGNSNSNSQGEHRGLSGDSSDAAGQGEGQGQGQGQGAAAAGAGGDPDAARQELLKRDIEAHKQRRWARKRMGRAEGEGTRAGSDGAAGMGLLLKPLRPSDPSNLDLTRGAGLGDHDLQQRQQQFGGGAEAHGAEQGGATTGGSDVSREGHVSGLSGGGKEGDSSSGLASHSGDASGDASGAGVGAGEQGRGIGGEGQGNAGAGGVRGGTSGGVSGVVSGGGGGAQGVWRERQERVSVAFRHAWRGYRDYAFGSDELLPLSRRGMDGLGSLGATIVDALDTAMLMGHADIVRDAGDWVVTTLPQKLATAGQVNLFETTIRVMGGLLTAYHLRTGAEAALGGPGASEAAKAGDTTFSRVPRVGPRPEEYLRVARDLGERLMSAFTMSPTAVPFADVILRERRAQNAGNGASSTAECTTLQMEFWELSRLTGDHSFADAAMKVMKHFQGLPKSDGLVPIYIDAHSGQFTSSEIRLGSRGDSYYEYLIKVWLQQGQGEGVAYLREMFGESMEGVRKWLLARSLPKGLTYIAERTQGVEGPLHPKMDHLVCFLPGSLILGATKGLSVDQARRAGLMTPTAEFYVELAANLTHTCYEMYNVTATGLAPEIAYFNMGGTGGREGTTDDSWFGEDINIHVADRHNLLRPETVEALFYMHRATRHPRYREWGWKIFQAFEQYTRVGSGGYTSLSDVTRIPPSLRDKMETFFLGETLKYFFLLFAEESLLPLDRYVLNTEAHPLPVVHQNAQTLSVTTS